MAPESSRNEGAGSAGARRPSPVALLSIGAIAVVVLLVALPSLGGLAMQQNERDAVRVVRALGHSAAQHAESLATAELFEAHPELAHRFRDLELLEDEALLRAHGYLFELVPAGAGHVVLAWPWEHGRTGFAALALDPEQGLFVSANREGRASGPASPPRFPGAAGEWRRLR